MCGLYTEGQIVLDMVNLERLACYGALDKVQVNSKKLKKLFTSNVFSDYELNCVQVVECRVRSEQDIIRLGQLKPHVLRLRWSNVSVTQYCTIFDAITVLWCSPQIASTLVPFLGHIRTLTVCGNENEDLALIQCKCVLNHLTLIDVYIDCGVLDSFSNTKSVLFERCNKEKTLDVSALSRVQEIRSQQFTGNLVGYENLTSLRHLHLFSRQQKLECQNMRLESLSTDSVGSVLCTTLKKIRMLVLQEGERGFHDLAQCTQLEHIDIKYSTSIQFESLLKNIGQLRTIKLKDDLTQDQEDDMTCRGYRISKKSGRVKFSRSI